MSITNLYLNGILYCYMFAFGSLYIQIPGLYGNSGILPVDLVIKEEPTSLNEFLEQPSLLRFKNRVFLSSESVFEAISLFGLLLSLFSIIFSWKNSLIFISLWFSYLSCFHVGQTFLWFQWDILLLEAGYLSIFASNVFSKKSYHDNVIFWLIKWLLFRLMFASGVVKLTSQCPTWWSLTALNYHYESQCIPTPGAWYAHQLPEWFQKLSTVGTYVIEIVLPFFYFIPGTLTKYIAFFGQILLMGAIMATGNYTFFNILTIVLSFSLLYQDQDIKSKPMKKFCFAGISWICCLISWLLQLFAILGAIYYTITLFSLKANSDFTVINSKIAFNQADLDKFLKWVVPRSISIGAILLAYQIFKALFKSVVIPRGCFAKTLHFLETLVYCGAACFLFAITLIPYTELDHETQQKLPSPIHSWNRKLDTFQLSSSYGLFRSMTGVGGRPEVILEGSYDINGPWYEYNFLYKTGNMSTMPATVAPHQPRLDWQMWFASLGSYQHNPWLLNLVYRLLQGKEPVLQLLDMNRSVFAKRPPEFIRAKLYLYHYTSFKSGSAQNWWWREFKADYLPAVSLKEESFVEYLKNAGLYSLKSEIKRNPNQPLWAAGLERFLAVFRIMCGGSPEGLKFLLSLTAACLIISYFRKRNRRN